jgi:hypothetical protein
MRPSPLQNRVAPTGDLVAMAARGAWLGNRGGRFHDPLTQTLTRRRWASRQWLCCVLSFKGRRRKVWGAGYTELFFSDEIAALAAGHRPCFECRRADATAFAEAVMRHDGLARAPSAPELDRRLHGERLDGRAKRLHRVAAHDLPDGATILHHGAPHALRGGLLLRWSFADYAPAGDAPRGDVLALTPPTILAALRAGYAPRWNFTA